MWEIFPQLLVNGLITGSLYALAAAGLSLCYGSLRVLNFAHGQLMMVGAYLYWWAEPRGLVLALLVSLLGCGLIGIIEFVVFLRPVLGINPLLGFLTSLSFGTVLEASVSIVFGVDVKALALGSGSSLTFWGVYITPLQIWIISVSIVLLAALAVLVHRTAWGRSVRGYAERPEAARALGVNSLRLCAGVVGLSAVLGGVGGVLFAAESNLSPTFGASLTIKALAALILGGLGNTWGALAGAFALGMIENLGIGIEIGGYSLPAGYKDAFAFLFILTVLLVRPAGLFGNTVRKV